MTDEEAVTPCASGLGYQWKAIERYLSAPDMDRFGRFIYGQTMTECPEHPRVHRG